MSIAISGQMSPQPAVGASQTLTATSDFEDFIYLISHDVRNSVRALIELPQWIVEDLQASGVKIDKSVAESIDLMNTHTGRLDRMLVDLLAYSRVGRMQDVVDVDIGLSLQEVLEEMRIPQGFAIKTKIAHDTLHIGERDALSLLTALVSNGFKHHDRETGTIELSTLKHNGRIRIDVADDGPGIPENCRDRVFAAMTTLRPRDEIEGSGMGLAIVQKIAATYGGSAEIVDTGAPRGTLVRVEIPAIASVVGSA